MSYFFEDLSDRIALLELKSEDLSYRIAVLELESEDLSYGIAVFSPQARKKDVSNAIDIQI